MGAQLQEAPSAHRHAKRLLEERGITVVKVVRVNPESILYLGASECPMTAWLVRDGARVKPVREPGFPAWPKPGLIGEEERV